MKVGRPGRWPRSTRSPRSARRRPWSARRARRVRRPRSPWVRIGGYGGAALLAAAAVVVLLMPLMDDGRDAGAAGAQGPANPSAAPTGGQPGGAGLPASPTRPAPQENRRGEPYPGGQGGGPEIPEQNGPAQLSWCPRGTAYYRAVRDGVDVVITVSSSGAIRAEMSLDGGRQPASQQTTVKGGGPHTFHFTGVPPQLVQRVKVTTVSVGVAMQTCYARVAA
ncbi:hypothetical protein E1287_04890 [Actinomadura sp. KC06]|uniref:hypothetical protein n=1 Tax=Actinomadura sp. KC06 TaxID=2530369 RepID=UPI0010503DED|nr:hypothetical protein [Actinomadura sp. KC06]TDD38879.1 hypothetical protein E1287_04890 [Actinomadura sp. KC06]